MDLWWKIPIYICAQYLIQNIKDLNQIIKGTLLKMKEALSQRQDNMKKIEYFDSMDSLYF